MQRFARGYAVSANPNHWTPQQLSALRQLYPDHSADVVARVIGRSLGSVHRKAALLGLSKSAAWLASDASGRIQRGKKDERLKSTQFKPGLTPWNKGVKGSTGTQPACRATQFKPGRKPEESRNYLPIGSFRLKKDGHLERKMTDDRALKPALRWTPVYRLVWEAEHGSIPVGHIVVFKTGMKTTVLEQITPERLECISRAENATRNSVHRHGPEMSRLYQLKGAINRQVNRLTREQQESTPA